MNRRAQRKKTMMFILCVCIVLQFVAVLSIVNTDVSQVIDASTSIVRYSAEIKAKEVNGEYSFIFLSKWGSNLAHFTVSSKGNSLETFPPISKANYTEITIKVDEKNPTLKVKAVFTGLLTPFPTEITQAEQQLVVLESSHYFFSLYETLNQKTVFKLASSSIESFTKISPHSVRGSSVHFGPFQDLPAFKVSELRIHYINNFPFAKFSSLVREVEVSHWGNIAIEEIYELKHAGAALKGGFSRFDYQMKRVGQSPSFRSLVAHLPVQASNIYYRDQIGNISTSDIRSSNTGDLELEIQTRFPMFGGWQTQFYIGYSVPTELALFRDSSDRFTLKFDFFTIFRDVWVEDLEIKIVLPEGCKNVVADVPYAVSKSETTRYTYLDSKLNGGRNVIILRTANVVEEHDQKVVISYEFPQSKLVVEPLMLVVAFLLVFVGCSLLSRASVLTSKSTKK